MNLFFNATHGNIPLERLVFASNKIYKKEGNSVAEIKGNIGDVISQLAEINCKLWHEVEKGYDIENVPTNEKNTIVKKLAVTKNVNELYAHVFGLNYGLECIGLRYFKGMENPKGLNLLKHYQKFYR
ncbi:MAG: hypothetical protein IPM51_11470 [Sphingobacteriaceae bacterium]|nr:hypothetical protein [Sphingobacteriaceae bacterium]